MMAKKKMSKSSKMMWECQCGNLLYNNAAPDECDKCWKMNSFTKVPGYLKEEKEKIMTGGFEDEYDEN